MPTARTARRHALALLAVALVAVACGGDTSTTSPPTTTTVTAPPTTTTTGTTADALRAALVRATDLPTGWKASPHTGPDTTNVCYGDVPTPRTKAYGDDHARGDFGISSSAAIFADDAQAHLVVLRPGEPAVVECLRAQLQAGIAAQPEAQDATVTVTATPIPTVVYGDESVALRGTIVVTPRTGAAETVVIDTLFVRTGRGGVIVQFVGPVPALDTDTANPLAALVVARVRAVIAAA